MAKFDPMAKPFASMTEAEQKWLRDQHPRGAAVIEANKEKFGDTVEEEDAPPYEQWSNAELVDELKARKLDSSGNKAEMSARLYEYDRQHES